MRRLLVPLLLHSFAWAAPPSSVEEARTDLAHGRYDLAERKLKKLGRSLAARLELAQLYEETDRTDKAEAIWHEIIDLPRRAHSPEQLVAAGIAARGLREYDTAHELFRAAVHLAPRQAVAHREWSANFLRTEALDEARTECDAALAIAPEDAAAHLLRAEIALAEGDRRKAGHELERALQRTPTDPAALALAAALALDEENSVELKKHTDALRAIHPQDERLLAIEFVARRLAGEAKVPDLRPARFYHYAAERLLRHQRYPEAVELERRALALRPDEASIEAALGEALLLLGVEQEKEALRLLAAAYRRDRFQRRVYELIHLFQEVLPQEYALLESPPFHLRIPQAQREKIEPALRVLLQSAWREFSERYQVVPPPVTVELYENPIDYELRTGGFYQGMTTGRVVALQLAGNWQRVLWHELSHVFALARSHGRVPRWLAEGLAELETARHDPAWRRRCPNFAPAEPGQLQQAFLLARGPAELETAYCQAIEAVERLRRHIGDEELLKRLDRSEPAAAVP